MTTTMLLTTTTITTTRTTTTTVRASQSSPSSSSSFSASSSSTTSFFSSHLHSRAFLEKKRMTRMEPSPRGRTQTTTNTNTNMNMNMKKQTTRLAALAFIPVQGVFTRNEDDETDLIPNPTFKQLEKYCEGWTVGRERGADDEDHLCRRFRAKNAKAGHRILEALQGRLMSEEERGCRIRRETQEMYYMCCDGVRVRMNEGKGSVLVEIPIEGENALLGQFKRKCKLIENIVEEQNKL